MSGVEFLAIGFALYVLGITTGLRWSRHAFPPKRDPNPFGELPPVQPLGDEAERWTYTVVDDGAIYVGEEPKLERMVWLATLDPITREPNGGALPVAIRQNANIHARN
jgi:hypothetical protein